MNKLDKLLNHKSYISAMEQIMQFEVDRKFCKHNMEHALDVARIAYIMNLEESLQIPKEIIYVTALLHDVGRALQYSKGIHHNEASIIIAKDILDDIGFDEKEKAQILDAIHHHNDDIEDSQHKNLNSLIKKADKLSRACFRCSAYSECYWDKELKNDTIIL